MPTTSSLTLVPVGVRLLCVGLLAALGCGHGERAEQRAAGAGFGGIDAGELPASATHPAADGGRSGAQAGGAGLDVPAAGAAAVGGGPSNVAGTGAAAAGQGGQGGVAPAGAPAAGGGAVPLRASYYLGADISDQEGEPPEVRARLLDELAAHGFNYVRLRSFVDPRAADGYDKRNGLCDLAHTIEFGQQIKSAGFGLLVDFHYSDNWADPGKQCVPIAWQKHTSIDALAAALRDYTRDAIAQLIAGGARPDMVQIGNEITPGMLLHRCDADGLPTGENPVNGSSASWERLGALLRAGVGAVREVDPSISIALHIDRGGDKPSDQPGAALALSIDWIENARQYIQFDAFGQSCYQRYQGDPASAERSKAGWQRTFNGLAQRFPELLLFAAEYGPAQREINDVVFELPERRGIGTFNWAPTTRGDWNSGGHDLWRRSGSDYQAQPDVALYDQMKLDYASRL